MHDVCSHARSAVVWCHNGGVAQRTPPRLGKSVTTQGRVEGQCVYALASLMSDPPWIIRSLVPLEEGEIDEDCRSRYCSNMYSLLSHSEKIRILGTTTDAFR